MPRVSIRSISQLLLGLTTDTPQSTQPLSDEIQLVERLGDARLDVVPAVRPRHGGGSDSFTAAATRFGVVQVRAAERPIYVVHFQQISGFIARWRVGDDLIETVRAASGDVFAFPQSAAIVEHGETAAAVVAGVSLAVVQVIDAEIYLEPGEVLAFHAAAAAQNLSGAFVWREVP